MKVIGVRGLTKSYGGVQALRGIGLSMVEGETVALLGPNGAGTTTMFDILEGFSRPTAGQVRVLGQDPERFDGAVLPVPALRRGGRWEVHTRTPTRDMAVIAGWALDRRLELSDLEVTRPALQDLYLALVGEVRDVEVVR